MFKRKNKAIKIVSLLFVLLFAADLTTTLLLGDLVPLLEANPLYKHIGLTGIALFNLIVLLGIFWWYWRGKNPTTRYVALNSLLTVTIIRIFVVVNNIKILRNPPTVQQASQLTQAAKTQYLLSVISPFLVPFLIGALTFIIFRWDHDIAYKQKRTKKNNTHTKKVEQLGY